jgi:iron complex transport system substrate-binding protein
MYGNAPAEFPRRIVCLSTEHVEICYALGAGDRVVGVPGTAHRPPEARDKPKVGAFTNPRSVDEVMQSILTVGGAIGAEPAARGLVLDMHDEINQLREFSSVWPDRPRVYFEEWHDPLISGIRWVSELIELAGGRDVFADLRDRRRARDRVVEPAEVCRRDPEIILVSWCGKPADLDAVRARTGWDRVSAVRHRRIHEIDSADVLSPGPSMLVGLRQIHELVQEALRERD